MTRLSLVSFLPEETRFFKHPFSLFLFTLLSLFLRENFVFFFLLVSAFIMPFPSHHYENFKNIYRKLRGLCVKNSFSLSFSFTEFTIISMTRREEEATGTQSHKFFCFFFFTYLNIVVFCVRYCVITTRSQSSCERLKHSRKEMDSHVYYVGWSQGKWGGGSAVNKFDAYIHYMYMVHNIQLESMFLHHPPVWTGCVTQVILNRHRHTRRIKINAMFSK